MSRGAQIQLNKSKDLPFPNTYVQAMYEEFSDWVFDEVEAEKFKGLWKSEVFKSELPLDLEIGTGTGTHFNYLSKKNRQRNLIGIELKYKPLIQSVRRALNNASKNMRMIRYNAALINNIFALEEVHNIYIHFPDPWPKNRGIKHRLLQKEFLDSIYEIHKKDHFIEFKTDNKNYFFWAMENIKQSKYTIVEYTEDLHNSDYKEDNFVTQFETYFLKNNQNIYYTKLIKN